MTTTTTAVAFAFNDRSFRTEVTNVATANLPNLLTHLEGLGYKIVNTWRVCSGGGFTEPMRSEESTWLAMG
jgi:hypothetical protein